MGSQSYVVPLSRVSFANIYALTERVKDGQTVNTYLLNTNTYTAAAARQPGSMMTRGRQWDEQTEGNHGLLQWLRQKLIYRVLNLSTGP